MFDIWKKNCDQPRQHIQKQRYYYANKDHLVKAMVFPVVMYGCKSWTIKKAEHGRTDVFELLEKTLESPSDCKEIQPVNPNGNQSWIFFERTDTEAETTTLWPPDVKNWLKSPWFWERLKVGEGDDRGWDGWIASLNQWTWVWVNSRSWWWTGRAWCAVVHGVAKRVRQDWVTELDSSSLQSILLQSTKVIHPSLI